jgi:hypothetical protein
MKPVLEQLPEEEPLRLAAGAVRINRADHRFLRETGFSWP